MRAVLTVFICSSFIASGQNTSNTAVAVTLSGSGFGYGCCTAGSGEAQGTLSPFTGTVDVAFDAEGTNANILITMPNQDLIKLVDASASLKGNVGSGTARVVYGTGAFNGMTGTLAYAVDCIVTVPGVSCVTMDGVPLSAVQTISMSGQGTFYIPAAAAGLTTPLPSSPPPGSTLGSYNTGTSGGIVNNIWNFLSGNSSSNISPRADSSSGPTAPATMTLTPPLEPFAVTYSAAAACLNSSGACWASIPQATGTIPAFSTAPITIDMAPPLSAAGVFPATVSVTLTPSPALSGQAPVILNQAMNAIVTNAGPMLAVGQTGLQFQMVSGVGGPASQSVAVADQGSQPLSFSTAVSGGSWLTVSPSSGSVAAGASASLAIGANPSGLAPGTYYGRVDVSSTGAFASPQSVEVVVNVLSSTASAAPVISPAGLIFVTTAGANPAPQSFQIANPSNQPFSVTVQSAATWYSAPSPPGSITSTQPQTEAVSVNVAGLSAGAYKGTISVTISGTNAVYTVPLVLIVQPSGGATCKPTKLLGVFTNQADGFQTTAGVPVGFNAQIVDDCGSPLTSGAVVATFPTDPAVSLVSSGAGAWSGAWTPLNLAGGAVPISLTAVSPAGLVGSAAISSSVTANATAPVIKLGGIASAAGLESYAPLAPGSVISIFGSNLADAATPATTASLPSTLANTQVLFGGRPMPLDFAGPGQINAIVPFETPVNDLQQLIVIHNGVSSTPQPIAVAATQPAVFTQNQSGAGPGAIITVKSDGTESINTATAPASPGDVLAIYCAGLGTVNPPVADGAPASASTLSYTVNPVAVTIGGEPATVLFSGLAPGFVGLYQVNVTVPAGVATGSDVPLVVTAGGLASPAVTVSIE